MTGCAWSWRAVFAVAHAQLLVDKLGHLLSELEGDRALLGRLLVEDRVHERVALVRLGARLCSGRMHAGGGQTRARRGVSGGFASARACSSFLRCESSWSALRSQKPSTQYGT